MLVLQELHIIETSPILFNIENFNYNSNFDGVARWKILMKRTSIWLPL